MLSYVHCYKFVRQIMKKIISIWGTVEVETPHVEWHLNTEVSIPDADTKHQEIVFVDWFVGSYKRRWDGGGGGNFKLILN